MMLHPIQNHAMVHHILNLHHSSQDRMELQRYAIPENFALQDSEAAIVVDVHFPQRLEMNLHLV